MLMRRTVTDHVGGEDMTLTATEGAENRAVRVQIESRRNVVMGLSMVNV